MKVGESVGVGVGVWVWVCVYGGGDCLHIYLKSLSHSGLCHTVQTGHHSEEKKKKEKKKKRPKHTISHLYCKEVAMSLRSLALMEGTSVVCLY